MAWEWSHTSEALDDLRSNLHRQPRGWLEEVYAEWEALRATDDFDEARYEAALSRARELPSDVLADEIFDRAAAQALCTNGGHAAYCCPYMCGAHEVGFDAE